MTEKLQQLHKELAEKLLEKVRDPQSKSSDLNVVRQFLKDNGIESLAVDNSPLEKIMNELPFEIPKKPEITN